MNSPRAGIAILLLLVAPALAFICATQSGCSSAGAGAHAGERYVVNSQRTLFYKYGPVQSTGPDFALYRGQTVTMLSREFGYSHIIVNDQSGYVSTEDLVPAPPELNPEPTPQLAARGGGGGGASARNKPGNTSSGSSRTGEGRRPTRSEEAAVPPPDLPQSNPAAPMPAPSFR